MLLEVLSEALSNFILTTTAGRRDIIIPDLTVVSEPTRPQEGELMQLELRTGQRQDQP